LIPKLVVDRAAAERGQLDDVAWAKKQKGKKQIRRIVVCNNGSLLFLSKAGAIHLLQHAGRILIPESVRKEFYQNAR
jgi:hypothetical protein